MDQGGIGFLVDPSKFPIIGEVSFACSSTEYIWQVPPGITSITAVCVGGGGGGQTGSNQTEGGGGGGGALRWVNGLVVEPGETLRIKAGLGGTGGDTSRILVDKIWGRPGKDSYIASDNNVNVSARSGIGDTIIVVAQGGGFDQFYVSDTERRNPANLNQIWNEATEVFNGAVKIENASGIGTSGGQGTTFGLYPWGTVGGGNGGVGGKGGGVGGGQDGGGGGAGGWFGNGGFGAEEGIQIPTDGQGGGGGGGMYGGGGGSYGSGGGGGVGVFWGNGPNGKNAYYYWDGTTLIQGDPGRSNSGNFLGMGGQGGSFGGDGRATGTEVIDLDDYAIGGQNNIVDGTFNNNYVNVSNGNGLRGYNSSIDNEEVAFNLLKPNGGDYGGGGGACQTGGTTTFPQAGDGGCGHVRILFVARNPFITREYGGERTVGTGAADETRTINGESVTVRFRDFDPSLSIADNLAAGWPAWNPTPQTGVYYNLLVNYASNLPFLNEGFLPAAAGISSNPSGYPI